MRGLQEMQPWAKKLVDHQPGQPGGEQPVDDPALSWPAHGDDDDVAWENCQQELGHPASHVTLWTSGGKFASGSNFKGGAFFS